MWTEEYGEKCQELTNKREQNESEVGKQHTIKMLKDMINSLENGEEIPVKIDIEYIRQEWPFGYEGTPPVVGKKITLIYR